jgi:hypothetical protein
MKLSRKPDYESARQIGKPVDRCAQGGDLNMGIGPGDCGRLMSNDLHRHDVASVRTFEQGRRGMSQTVKVAGSWRSASEQVW